MHYTLNEKTINEPLKSEMQNQKLATQKARRKNDRVAAQRPLRKSAAARACYPTARRCKSGTLERQHKTVAAERKNEKSSTSRF